MFKPKYKKSHRSGLEDAFRDLCDKEGLKVGYEDSVLPYVTDPQKKRCIPDWTVREGVYIETKGRFTAQDRKKALYVKEQHPDVRILYVFQRPGNTLSKASKTTYADWCNKQGIEWCAFSDTDHWQAFIIENQRTTVGLRHKKLSTVPTKKKRTKATAT